MTMPLYVDTAISLGWTEIRQTGPFSWTGFDRYGNEKEVTRYDKWCFCGPLIEEFKISVTKDEYFPSSQGWYAFPAFAEARGIADHRGSGKSAPEAVCRLIVELHKAGRLKAA